MNSPHRNDTIYRSVKHIPPWSVIRLIGDGRLAIRTNNEHRGHVMLKYDNGFGFDVPGNFAVEIVKYPAELAGDYLREHTNE